MHVDPTRLANLTVPARPAIEPRAPRPGAAAGPDPAAAPMPSPAEPTLWELLTDSEREFFAQQAALGPLRYAPGGVPPSVPPGPTGKRLDVKA